MKAHPKKKQNNVSSSCLSDLRIKLLDGLWMHECDESILRPWLKVQTLFEKHFRFAFQAIAAKLVWRGQQGMAL